MGDDIQTDTSFDVKVVYILIILSQKQKGEVSPRAYLLTSSRFD